MGVIGVGEAIVQNGCAEQGGDSTALYLMFWRMYAYAIADTPPAIIIGQ